MQCARKRSAILIESPKVDAVRFARRVLATGSADHHLIAEPLEARRLLSASPALNLLFFGNSFTYNTSDGPQYNMPQALKSIAVADGFAAPNVYEQILLGETLADHLSTIAADGSNNIIVHSLPAGQQWSDVVMQEYSTRPTNATALEGDVPLFRSDALQLYNQVRANSPAVHGVLYETWARGPLNSYYPSYFSSPTDMQNQLQTNYGLAAGDINSADGAGSAVVSPVGEGWRSLNWEASLYSTVASDGVEYHPSTEGELLNAMVLFESIYHTTVSGIPLANVAGILSNLGLTDSIWTALASVATSVVSLTDTTPPTASLTSAPALTADGNAPYTFAVTYSDNVAVQVSSLGNQNLLITGSNGYSELATLQSTGLTNGPSVTATYSIPAPASGWGTAADGSYMIALQANQLTDTSGNFALAGDLGNFSVSIPSSDGGSLVASAATAAASYNLTTVGTSDWADWALGGSASAFDHKAAGGSQISNVTRIGTAGLGGWSAAGRSVSWTDGIPIGTATGNEGYLYANTVGGGYSFTVPASTATRTLYVYLGGYSSGSTLTAHLSDGSAADFAENLSSASQYSDIVAITYNAASAGQTLTVSYVKSQNINGTSGTADFTAAWLVGSVPASPPVVGVNPSSQGLTVGQDAKFSAAASGTPTLTVQWEVATAGSSSFTAITGATSTTLDLGAATLAESGNKYEAVFSNGIGTPITTTAATLTVTPKPTGSLSGTSTTAAASYNLAAVGTSDWATWGLGGSANAFDHKASGGSQISNVTAIGTVGLGGYTAPVRNVSWTGGSPVASSSGEDGYLYSNTVGDGYSFTVPAGTSSQTLYVYLGGYSSGSTLTAQLTDGSAAQYVANLSSSSKYSDLIAITFNAASAGQTLNVSYVKSANVNGTSGTADLAAAWLA